VGHQSGAVVGVVKVAGLLLLLLLLLVSSLQHRHSNQLNGRFASMLGAPTWCLNK
jgi:hypothetical protein